MKAACSCWKQIRPICNFFVSQSSLLMLAAAPKYAKGLQGLRIVDLYAKKGIEPSRLYIKAWPLHAGFRASLAASIICMLYESVDLGDR